MPKDAGPRKLKAETPSRAEVTRKAHEAAHASKPEFTDKVNGPQVPGAEARPVIGKAKMGKKLTGTMTAHAEKIMRVNELKRLLQPLTPSLIQVMSDVAHDKKVHPAVRLDAADRLLNRLYGKPTESLIVNDPDEVGTDQDEVKTLLNNILKSVGAPMLEFHDDAEKPGDAG